MRCYYQTRNTCARRKPRIFGTQLTNLPQSHLPHQLNQKQHATHPMTHELMRTMPEMQPYHQEIFECARRKQEESYIKDNYMARSMDLSVDMREKLIGWLVEIQPTLKFKQETLYLGVFIIDKYCESQRIDQENYQLLGLTAIFVAGKYEQVKTPRLKNYAQIVRGVYSTNKILEMESQILLALCFKIRIMTSVDYLDEGLNLVKMGTQVNTLSRYLLELCLIDYDFCLLKPSIVSWGVILVASNRLGLIDSQNHIINICGLSSKKLSQTVKMTEAVYSRRQDFQYRDINKKYNYSLRQLML